MSYTKKSMLIVALVVSGFGLAFAKGALFPGQKLKKPLMVAHYAGAKLKCWSAGTVIVDVEAKTGLVVYQYDEDKQHLWLEIGSETSGSDLVMGADTTCSIVGTRSSSLD